MLEQPADERVPRLVEGDDAPLVRVDGEVLLLEPRDDAVNRQVEGLGADVVAEPLPPAPGLADAEPIVLVRAEFAPSSRL